MIIFFHMDCKVPIATLRILQISMLLRDIVTFGRKTVYSRQQLRATFIRVNVCKQDLQYLWTRTIQVKPSPELISVLNLRVQAA